MALPSSVKSSTIVCSKNTFKWRISSIFEVQCQEQRLKQVVDMFSACVSNYCKLLKALSQNHILYRAVGRKLYLGKGGGGGWLIKFFDPRNILRLQKVFFQKVGGTCPPSPLLPWFLRHCFRNSVSLASKPSSVIKQIMLTFLMKAMVNSGFGLVFAIEDSKNKITANFENEVGPSVL